ncbi:DUF1805 domain-containing protein [Sporosarcina sp. ANT_H38]|uniref:YunC family protein n=1 Tax=unclassified Sporosarcina TaxID=2647733 RepID=UPI0011F1B68B|nr:MULTISPECIES: DUF1805 domain-containing protein [unclassified Sporosarcina]KAA0940620.1 DUF1805 domain-containing protein [Sporosarcina sp. ANT_H38]QJS06578.1 hypothetical protein [Sporosarcina sp.]
MIDLKAIDIEGHIFFSALFELPKTTLIYVGNNKGYIMCSTLDIGQLNEKLEDSNVIAGIAVEVKTVDQLLEASLEAITYEAEELGIKKGMIGREALLKMV